MRILNALTALVVLFTGVAALSAAEKPNVVFILADDLGIGDVECFGGEKCQIPTPNFDRIAQEGMKFTDAHPDVSHCVPTRMALMTGRHPWRYANPKQNGPWGYLTPRFSTDTFTLGDLMQRAGYRTGYIGKWHLGTTMPTTDGKVQGPENVDFTKPLIVSPNDYGFDDTFILPGSLDMFPYVFVKNGVFQGSVTAQKGWSAFNRVGPAAEDFVDTEVIGKFTTEAEKFIATPQLKSQPFFLFLALTSPHTPVSPSKSFEGKSGLGLYGDFVHETDHCVGRVLDALDAAGLSENTLVIATSDHGAAAYAGNIRQATPFQFRELEQLGHYSGGGYRGFKFSIYEGGLRIPFVAKWPKVIPAGQESDELIGLVDLMGTLSQITGVEIPEGSGADTISFLPLLKDPSAEGTRKEMILQSTHSFAIRRENWKLTLSPGSGSAGRFGNRPISQESWKAAVENSGRVSQSSELLSAPYVQLFNLDIDPEETNNLAADHPEKVQELFSVFQTAIDRGRATPGPNLKNDRPINPWQHVPRFVFQK